MISRCPSCAAEVDDAASRCPSCHWDFELRKRVPPDGKEPPPDKPAAKAPPAKREEDTISPEPQLPGLAGLAIPVKPSGKPAPKAPEPQRPASPAPGSGLKQFGKIDPPAAKEEGGPDGGFAIPSLPAKKGLEDFSPPATEIRRGPSGKTPAPDKKAEKTPEKDKEHADPADRFRKKGRTQPPKPKDGEKVKPGFRFDAKVAAAVAVLLIVSAVGAYLSMRPSPSSSSPAKPQPGASPLSGKLDAAANLLGKVQTAMAPEAAQPDRDIHTVQRVAVDSQLGVVKVNVPLNPPAVPAPAAPIPATPPAPAAAWAFEGQIYDLITLEPVVGAQIVFRAIGAMENTPGVFVTDKRGRFKFSLPVPASGGYELTVSHPEYLDGYIDEMSPPLKEAELDERRMLAASAARNAVWIGNPNKTTKRDFIMVPKRMD